MPNVVVKVTRWEKPQEPPNRQFVERDLRREGYRTEFWVDRPGTRYLNRRFARESIVWVLQGRARLEWGDGQSVELGMGDRATVPAGTTHTIGVVGDRRLYWLVAFKK